MRILCIKLEIKPRLYYDARSSNHQDDIFIYCRHLQAMPLRNLKLLNGARSISFVGYPIGETTVI